jgi:hypothetical protein
MRPTLIFLCVLVALTAPAEARVKRSQSAKVEFKREHPCPATGAIKGPCTGYVIDHVVPLACGGADSPDNMQWQTVAEGKEKDKWERRACSKSSLGRDPVLRIRVQADATHTKVLVAVYPAALRLR